MRKAGSQSEEKSSQQSRAISMRVRAEEALARMLRGAGEEARATCSGEGGIDGEDAAERRAIRGALAKWIAEAQAAPEEARVAMSGAAMTMTFSGIWRDHHGFAASRLLAEALALSGDERSARLAFAGSMHRPGVCDILPLSFTAGSGDADLAEAVGALSLEDCEALGEAGSPGFGASAAAQLCAAGAANRKASGGARLGCVSLLGRLCQRGPGVAERALVALCGEIESADPVVAWLDPARYRMAFEGRPLSPEVLSYLLARRIDGQGLIDWCRGAGFEGASWPASFAGCAIGLGDWSPEEGLAEAGGDRLIHDPDALAGALRGLPAPPESERRELARALGSAPRALEAIWLSAPEICGAIFESPERKALAWSSLRDRVAAMGAIGPGERDFGEPLARSGAVELSRSLGLEFAGANRAWAEAALEREIQSLRETGLQGHQERAAELERSLLENGSGAPSAKRRRL